MKTKLVLIMFLFGIILSGCGWRVEDEKVLKAVEKQGYINLVITDKSNATSRYGCFDADAAYTISATNPRGVNVDIIACAAYPFKGASIITK